MTAGRKRAQGDDIQIAVERLGEGLRNGGRRHEKDVRAAIFLVEHQTLPCAETVLFINDEDSRTVKRY